MGWRRRQARRRARGRGRAAATRREAVLQLAGGHECHGPRERGDQREGDQHVVDVVRRLAPDLDQQLRRHVILLPLRDSQDLLVPHLHALEVAPALVHAHVAAPRLLRRLRRRGGPQPRVAAKRQAPGWQPQAGGLRRRRRRLRVLGADRRLVHAVEEPQLRRDGMKLLTPGIDGFLVAAAGWGPARLGGGQPQRVALVGAGEVRILLEVDVLFRSLRFFRLGALAADLHAQLMIVEGKHAEVEVVMEDHRRESPVRHKGLPELGLVCLIKRQPLKIIAEVLDRHLLIGIEASHLLFPVFGLRLGNFGALVCVGAVTPCSLKIQLQRKCRVLRIDLCNVKHVQPHIDQHNRDLWPLQWRMPLVTTRDLARRKNQSAKVERRASCAESMSAVVGRAALMRSRSLPQGR